MSTAYAVTKVRQHEFNIFCGVASFEATLGTWNLLLAKSLWLLSWKSDFKEGSAVHAGTKL